MIDTLSKGVYLDGKIGKDVSLSPNCLISLKKIVNRVN
jgi:hypothetical protein